MRDHDPILEEGAGGGTTTEGFAGKIWGHASKKKLRTGE